MEELIPGMEGLGTYRQSSVTTTIMTYYYYDYDQVQAERDMFVSDVWFPWFV